MKLWPLLREEICRFFFYVVLSNESWGSWWRDKELGSHSPCSRRHLIDIKSVRLSQPHRSIVQLVSSGASITLGGERWWGEMATGPCSSELVEPASTGTQMASVPTFYFLFSIYKLPLYRLRGQLE